MANLFFDLPVTPGNGAGTPVSTAAMGGEKTITVQDAFRGAINIEISCDGGSTWAQVVALTATGKRVVSFAADMVRAVRSGVPAIDPGLPNVDISASDFGALFAIIPSNGTPVDTSLLGSRKTVIVQGMAPGGTINIQISDDGVSWATCMTFKASDVQFKGFTSKFMRSMGPGATISVGASNDGDGSGLDEKVKVSGADTTPGYLVDKLVAGSGVALAVLNPGADEDTEISVSGADAGNIDTGPPITVRGPINAEGASLQIARADHDHRLELEVEDEGALAGARPTINFVGLGVGAADDPGNDRVNITIPGNVTDGASVVRSLYSDLTVSTSNTDYVNAMSGLSIPCPIDGTYWAIFEGSATNQNANGTLEIGISINGSFPFVAVPNSERLSQGNANDQRPVLTTVNIGALVAGDQVFAVFRKNSGAGSVTMLRRNLSIFKVQ